MQVMSVDENNGSGGKEEVEFDRRKAVKEFDETKSGVKGLLDSGCVEIPRIFIHPPENLWKSSYTSSAMELQVPVIDLSDLNGNGRVEILKRIFEASQTWGFFQMVNHGIPGPVMEEAIDAVRSFHEQPTEKKMDWYSRDPEKKVRFYSNGNLYVIKSANWRDSISFNCEDGELDCDALPLICRKGIEGYMECMIRLKETVSELISEALGLSSDFLASIDCMRTATLVCHYYPCCPQPNLTLGATKHSDPSFLTILLQDDTGGLQVLHQNHWVDVHPIKGALIANIGDLMQLITNDKFRSVEHRVLARQAGPRISVACFFYPSTVNVSKPYGPIKEFVSDNNPAVYRETHMLEYHAYYRLKGLDGDSALPHFKLYTYNESGGSTQT